MFGGLREDFSAKPTFKNHFEGEEQFEKARGVSDQDPEAETHDV